MRGCPTFLSHLSAGPGHVSSQLDVHSPRHSLTCFTVDTDQSCAFVHRNSKQMIIPTRSCQVHLWPEGCGGTEVLLKPD